MARLSAFVLALLLVQSLVLPALADGSGQVAGSRRTLTSCQFGDPFGAAAAACSVSCFAQHRDFHGGHCDRHFVCHCN